jgi:glycosyltransferase involved in cell wall biosynthesis
MRQIARFHEVWVVTRANNRAAIERKMAVEPRPNVHFVYVDLPHWLMFWKKGDRGIHFYYYIWQLWAYFAARRVHQKIGFELGHHITFVNDWSPSFLCFMPFPFVWGPVGGSKHRAPVVFWKEFGFRGIIYEAIRTLAIYAGRYVDPFVLLTRIRARSIITMSEGAVAGFPRSMLKKVFALGNVGISPDELPQNIRGCNSSIKRPVAEGEFIVFTTGRLVHWKGYSVLLKACEEYHRNGGRLTLWIGGDGPEEAHLKYLAAKLGIQKMVKFLGRLPDRESVFNRLALCDVFVMPTFHDGPPVVFLEAMAVGRPIVCLDLCGASEVVTPECGIILHAVTLPQVIGDLAKALKQLSADPELRYRLGAGGQRHVERVFGWDTKGDLLMEVYRLSMSGEEQYGGLNKRDGATLNGAMDRANELSLSTLTATLHARINSLHKHTPDEIKRAATDKDCTTGSKAYNKVLISAYACEPDRGSEQEVGWQRALHMVPFADEVWVLTRANNKHVIESNPLSHTPGLHFIYYDLPRWALWFKQRSWFLFLYFSLWQWGAYRLALQHHREKRFDLVYHVTFTSIRFGTFMGRLGIPFVIGPIAGGERAPLRLRRGITLRSKVGELLRDLGIIFQTYSPVTRSAFAASEHIYVTTAASLRLVPFKWRYKTTVHLAIGTQNRAIHDNTRYSSANPCFVYAGSLICLKGVHLAIRALAEARKTIPLATLTLFGNGSDEDWLRAIAKRCGVSHAVNFLGRIPRPQLIDSLHRYTALVFPSLHDSGGMAVLEALAVGIPVVCLDIGGPGVVVNHSCGFVLPTKNANETQLVMGIANSMISLGTMSPVEYERLSMGAIARANELSWNSLVSHIVTLVS